MKVFCTHQATGKDSESCHGAAGEAEAATARFAGSVAQRAKGDGAGASCLRATGGGEAEEAAAAAAGATGSVTQRAKRGDVAGSSSSSPTLAAAAAPASEPPAAAAAVEPPPPSASSTVWTSSSGEGSRRRVRSCAMLCAKVHHSPRRQRRAASNLGQSLVWRRSGVGLSSSWPCANLQPAPRRQRPNSWNRQSFVLTKMDSSAGAGGWTPRLTGPVAAATAGAGKPSVPLLPPYLAAVDAQRSLPRACCG